MKNLASEMQSKSSILSLALSLSTIVILLGIFGLVVVANHRQRKREQLKAILRAKNLGPVLESRKIASEVGNNFNFLPKYTQVNSRAGKNNSLFFESRTDSNPIFWVKYESNFDSFESIINS